MFWRFGFSNASPIDTILEKESFTLEELLDEEELLPECKAHNSKLIDYLSRKETLERLLRLANTPSATLPDHQSRYPYVACEILSCEVWPIVETCCDDAALLLSSWEFIENEVLASPVTAEYFSKVWGVFLQKKTREVLAFLKERETTVLQHTVKGGVVKLFLRHMEASAIMDLLLKLISLEELPDGHGVVDWLNEQGLMSELVECMHPSTDSDTHATAAQVLLDIITISQSSNPDQPTIGTNALIRELKGEVLVSRLVDYMLDKEAPNSTSTLVNGVAIFIELIRRNYSEIEDENAEVVHQHVDLSDLIRVLARRLPEFQRLLIKPKSITDEIDTTIGKYLPLGFERLRVCELFAELLHLSNMPLLNAIPAEFYDEEEDTGSGATLTETMQIPPSVTERFDDDYNVISEDPKASLVKETVVAAVSIDDSAAMERIVDEKNRALAGSSQVEDSKKPDTKDMPLPHISIPHAPLMDWMRGASAGDALKLSFIENGVLSTCLDLFFHYPWNNFLHTVVYDMVHQVLNLPLELGCNRQLIVSLFKDAKITRRITQAQRSSDYYTEQPKGVRLGYMGHLTFIADQVVRLIERSGADLAQEIGQYINMDDWHYYVTRTLPETKDKDRQALGGSRPNQLGSNVLESEEEEEDEHGNMDGDVASDQFARYLCQQITGDLPERFGSSDDDEEEISWNELDKEMDFSIRGPFAGGNNLDDNLVSVSTTANPVRLDLEDSDDDEHYEPIPPTSSSIAAAVAWSESMDAVPLTANDPAAAALRRLDDDDDDDDTFFATNRSWEARLGEQGEEKGPSSS